MKLVLDMGDVEKIGEGLLGQSIFQGLIKEHKITSGNLKEFQALIQSLPEWPTWEHPITKKVVPWGYQKMLREGTITQKGLGTIFNNVSSSVSQKRRRMVKNGKKGEKREKGSSEEKSIPLTTEELKEGIQNLFDSGEIQEVISILSFTTSLLS